MFYEKLRKLCFERGISVSKMAIDLKISTTTVTGWKRGAEPQAAQVKKIAGYFKISVEELMCEIPAEASPAGLPDDRADLINIIKAQQDAILLNLSETNKNISESNRNMAETNQNLTELSKNISESNKHIASTSRNLSETSQNISESNQNLSVSTQNLSEAHKNISASNKNLSEAVKKLSGSYTHKNRP